MKPFGSGHVVVTDGKVTDDGDFYTTNGDPVTWRWLKVWNDTATYLGDDPPPRMGKNLSPGPYWQTRSSLAAFPLASVLQPGEYKLRIWGGVDTDPEWYEIGSGNPADNGATDVRIETTFRIGDVPPPPDAIAILRAGVVRLEGSDAYRRGFSNVVAGTKACRSALELLD